MAQQDSLKHVNRLSAGATTLVVDPERRFQTIEGFGGAFTESGATIFSKLSSERQQEVLKAYFDDTEGHGGSTLSLSRILTNKLSDFVLYFFPIGPQP
jgi:O-glycosyl hydrolase